MDDPPHCPGVKWGGQGRGRRPPHKGLVAGRAPAHHASRLQVAAERDDEPSTRGASWRGSDTGRRVAAGSPKPRAQTGTEGAGLSQAVPGWDVVHLSNYDMNVGDHWLVHGVHAYRRDGFVTRSTGPGALAAWARPEGRAGPARTPEVDGRTCSLGCTSPLSHHSPPTLITIDIDTSRHIDTKSNS